MKTLKQILFIMIFVIGVTISASAQKNDPGQKTPPKTDPPKINVPDKKDPPKEKPRGDDRNNDNRGKKPEMAFVGITGKIEII